MFSNLNSDCSNLLDLRNFQEQVKKKHSDTKNCSELSLFEQIVLVISKFANSQPSASNFKSFSQSLEQFFLTVGPE